MGALVGKFAGNIYKDEYFTDSVYYDYMEAFWQGYNMQLYLYATECLEETGGFMDSFHDWSNTSTRRRKNTELWDLFFITTGTVFNEAWYRCFLFYDDITTTYLKKWSEFNDFGDIYLSFIFNMLANSLNIKTQTENMIGAYDEHDTVVFVRSLGSLLKSVIDFDSYQSISSSNEEPVTSEEFWGYTKTVTKVEPKWERQSKLDKRIEEATQKMEARMEAAKTDEHHNDESRMPLRKFASMINPDFDDGVSGPDVMLGNGYKWKARDYIQAPIGLLIGALHALPADTNGPACSSNATSFRQFLLEGIDYSSKTDKMEKAEAFYKSFGYLDEVGVLCQESVTSTLSKSYWKTFGENWYTMLFINLAYNAGFMWVDAINFIYFTPDTVP